MRGEALLLNIPSVFPMSAAGQALSVDGHHHHSHPKSHRLLHFVAGHSQNKLTVPRYEWIKPIYRG